MRCSLASLSLLVVILTAVAATPRASADCTGCHVTLKKKQGVAHSYRDWELSRHAAEGVSCVNCHGGDSEAELADEAHIHIEFSGDPQAMDAARSVLLTQGCGNCHRRERESFRRSPHQRALAAGELAADCTTCHGVLGTKSLDPLDIRDACERCHGGGELSGTMGVTQSLIENVRRVRRTLDLPEPGQRLDLETERETETSVATALDALHALNLDAAGLLPPAEPPHCTGCHAELPQRAEWAHSYADWEDSLHAYFDVSCVNCHGGDAEAEDADEAHDGVVLAGTLHRETNDYRLIVSDGCGNCHPNEIAGFRASPHYRALKAGKRAADCATCHGAVGSHVLTPQTITATCRQCHTDDAPGTTVGVAQTLLEYTRRVRMALVFPEPGQRLRGEERYQVEEAITAAMAAWHEFNLEAVGLALAHGTGVIER
ncbi:MAG: multiheme c-type cytochrome [Nitrospirota bacterium]